MYGIENLHLQTVELWSNTHNQDKMPPRPEKSLLEEDVDAMSVSAHDDTSSSDSDEDSVLEVRKFVPQDKDSDEEDLERFVLGDTENFREQLRKDFDFGDAELDSGDAEHDGTGHEELDDSQLFFFDAPPAGPKDLALGPAKEVAPAPADEKDPPAWHDSDDERLTVSLATATQLRKLRLSEDDDVITGTEYTRRLRQQFKRLNPLPNWAKASEERPVKRRRRSSAASGGSGASELSESDEEDDGDLSALPLDSFLRDASSLKGASTRAKTLRPEVIDIQRSRDMADSHKVRKRMMTLLWFDRNI